MHRQHPATAGAALLGVAFLSCTAGSALAAKPTDPKRQVVTTTDVDTNNDGTTDRQEILTKGYDNRNRLVRDVAEEDSDVDGVIDASRVVTRQYDKAGRLLQTVTVRTSNLVSLRDTTTNTYDGDGYRVLELSEADNDGDGVLDVRVSTTFANDGQGNVLVEMKSIDRGADGSIDSVRKVTSTYDAAGRRLTEITEADSPVDNVADFRVSVASSYNAAGAIVEQVAEVDGNGDGTVDEKSRDVYSYDAAGRLVSTVQDVDDNADGTPSSRVLRTFLYGPGGELVRARIEYDQAVAFGGAIDGVIDAVLTRHNTYDSAGNKIEELVDDQAGSRLVRQRTIFTYDADGRVLSSNVTTEIDRVLVFEQTIARTYNSRGQLIGEVTESDFDGDGAINGISTSTTVYDGIKR